MCSALVYLVYTLAYNPITKTQSKPHIYALMVTGKDACRTKLARLSVANFYDQTYENKHLVILNHGPDAVIDNEKNGFNSEVFEFRFEKTKKLTLGDIRNISLDLVPINALWAIWDDDDWRSPDYLEILQKNMEQTNAVCVSISSRIEYNANTQFIWEARLKTGFVLVLAKSDNRVRYMPKDTMEDLNLLDDYKSLGRVTVLDNDPLMYIRLVHNNNTSLYVNKNKSTVSTNVGKTYIENNVTDEVANKVRDITNRYYTNINECSI